MHLRLLHFSDPHFAHITRHPGQFFSKQWLGNLNQLLFRRYSYSTAHLQTLPALATTLRASHIAITGDFSTTSQPIEFENAMEFVSLFYQPVLTLPGNHDVYTKAAGATKRYYHYFPSPDMETTRISTHQLTSKWWWIGLDCTRVNTLWKSNGIFLSEMEQPLIQILNKIPRDHKIIVANHFPLIGQNRPSHDMERLDILKDILHHYPNVKLYLHGHVHTPAIVEHDYPRLILNPGSASKVSEAYCYFLALDSQGCLLQRYCHEPMRDWYLDLEHSFLWAI